MIEVQQYFCIPILMLKGLFFFRFFYEYHTSLYLNFILCMWVFCLYVCLYTLCMLIACRRQKRVSGVLELEFQIVVNCHMNAES